MEEDEAVRWRFVYARARVRAPERATEGEVVAGVVARRRVRELRRVVWMWWKGP